MKVPKSLWNKSHAGEIVATFPGVMHSYLLHATAPQLLRAQNLLPVILWRWYHLVNALTFDNSPANVCEMIRKGEGWPDKGMFYPTAKLDMQSKGGIPQSTITISLDYIAFEEMPILEDILLTLEGQTTSRSLGPLYQTLLSLTLKVYAQASPPNNTPEVLFLMYVNTVLMYSYTACQLEEIKNVFSISAWMEYWHTFLFQQIPDSLEKDEEPNILDSFILHMRKTIPHFGASMEELEKCDVHSKDAPSDNLIQYFHTGTLIADTLLIPLSLYAPLIRPTYLDQGLFERDVRKSLDIYTNGEELSVPSGGGVALTVHGNHFIKSVKNL